MTERLDRIEAALERTGENLKQTTAKQAKNTEDIDTLLGAIARTDRQVQDLRGESGDAQQRFEVLRAEAQNDRQETRQLWNDAVTQMERDRAEARERAEADRTEARERAETDRAENAKRFDAQQEVIQRLLIELVEMNRDNRRLRDRVDRIQGMEQAS